MLDIVLPLIVSGLCFRSYLGSALIFLAMLYLRSNNMTVVLDGRSTLILGVLTILSIFLVAVERKIRHIGRSRNIFMFMMVLAIQIVRFPVNFIFAQDIIFRLQNWVPLPPAAAQGDHPSIGAAAGGMLDFPLMLLVILSGIVIVFQLRLWIYGEDRRGMFS